MAKDIFQLINDHPDNVAEGLGDDALKDVSRTCNDGYEADVGSREEYIERIDDGIRLATQVIEEKSYPWPGSANVKYPLITEGAMRFSAEAYPKLIPGLRPVKGQVIGQDPDGMKHDSAQRVAKHMSWQILHEMSEWEEDMDELLILVAIVGTMFKKTFHDGERNRSDTISPKNLVVDYHTRHLQRATRITHQLFFTENEVVEKQREGKWLDVDLGESTGTYRQDSGDELPKDVTGFERSGDDSDSPRMILEQHTWLDLDDDGYKEPWIVTFDHATGTVLRIMPRFDEASVDTDADDKIIKIRPDNYFTKFTFIPNPDRSVYGLGLYHLVGPLNEATNTIINQLIDAGTLSNLQSGFISKGLQIRGGNHNFRPGEWKTVNATYEDLKKGIYPLPVREPSNVLLELLGTLIQSGQRLTSTQDAMAGTSDQHNQKTGAAEQNIKQGMKVFNGIYKRLHRSLNQEYKKLFELNALYLSGTEYFTVLDADVEALKQGVTENDLQQKVVESDYDPENIDVIPSSSPNIESEQEEMQKASMLYQMAQDGTVNPQVATKRILEAQDQPAVEELLEIPESQPSFEQQIEMQKAETERMKVQGELQLKQQEAQTNKIKAVSDALRNIAQAEGEEKGRQLDEYRAILETLRDQDEAETRREEAQARAQQQRQQAQQRQAAPSGGNTTR